MDEKTENKIEEKLRQANQEWDRTFNAISDHIFIQDAEHNIVKVNKAFAELMRARPEDLIGKKCFEVLHNLNHPWPNCPLKSTRMDLKPHTEEIDDPNIGIPLLITVSPILNDKGELTGVVHISKDISERKRIEKEVQYRYEIQSAINALVTFSLGEVSLQQILEKALEAVISMSVFSFEAKGAIFLVEDDPGVLVLRAHKNLPVELRKVCARIPFGKCLCGKAALSASMQFASTLDARHEIRYHGMLGHGHYCMPVISYGKVIGVLNTYVKDGYQYDKKDEDFLNLIANTLSGVIERKRLEDELKNRIDRLERFQRVTVGRELRMKELKGRVKELEDKLNSKT